MTDPLVILPNMEAVLSQFYRDQPEVEALVGDRVYTAMPATRRSRAGPSGSPGS